MSKRYAEGTTVSVDSSRGEITGILAKHGVTHMGWTHVPGRDELVFDLKGGRYRFTIEEPSLDDVKQMAREDGRDLRYISDWDSKIRKEWMRRWRANVLLLKAKLEFAGGGDTTITRELLPYRVLADGRTLEESITDGTMPLLLADGR